VIGLTLELALPISLIVFPSPTSTASAGNITIETNSSTGCAVFQAAPNNLGCAIVVTVVAIWNVVGIGVAVLGVSWILQYRRENPKSVPTLPAPPVRLGMQPVARQAGVSPRPPQPPVVRTAPVRPDTIRTKPKN
jgi:hypothetical protein